MKPDWQRIKAEAQAIEQRLQNGELLFGEHRAVTQAHIAKWLGALQSFTAVDNFKTRLQAAKLYRQWQNVPIDYPALIAVPKDFDLYNKKHMQTLIDSKCTLLKEMLQTANIRSDSVDLNAVLDDLAAMLLIIATDIPEDLDFNDEPAVLKLKNEKLRQVKPIVIRLVGRILNEDLEAVGVGRKLGQFNEVIDILLTDNNNGQMTAAKAIAAAANDNQMKTDANLLATFQRKLPRVEAALQGETIAGIDLPDVAKNTAVILALIEAKIPLIERQLNKLQHDHSPAAIVSCATSLYGHLEQLMEHEATVIAFPTLRLNELKQMLWQVSADAGLKPSDWEIAITQLQILITIPENWAPAGIQGFIAFIKGKAREVLKLAASIGVNEEVLSPLIDPVKDLLQQIRLEGIDKTEAIAQLEALAQIPDDLAWNKAREVIHLLKSKIKSLLALAGHIRIEGIDTGPLIAKATACFDALLDIPKDADLDSLTGILLMILDKIIPWMRQSTLTNNAWLLEQMEKVRMVVQFIHDNGPFIKLQDTIPLHRQPPAAKTPMRLLNAGGQMSVEQIKAHLSRTSG